MKSLSPGLAAAHIIARPHSEVESILPAGAHGGAARISPDHLAGQLPPITEAVGRFRNAAVAKIDRAQSEGRFDVSLFAQQHLGGQGYLPSLGEFAISFGIVSGGILAFAFVAKFFPLFGDEERRPVVADL